MIDFKYDMETGNLLLFDSSRLGSFIRDILKKGFKLGDNTIYLRPTYIDLNGNPLKKSGTITFGSSEDVNIYRSATNVLKTDDNFDALALRINGTEVITSGRDVHAVNLYGTAHYADIYFQDLECPLCKRKFKEHDKLVLIVTKVSDKEIRCLPAHLECDG